jgi:hypothetical protein
MTYEKNSAKKKINLRLFEGGDSHRKEQIQSYREQKLVP